MNETNIAPLENTNLSFGQFNLQNGNFLWNIFCNDTAGNGNFSATNLSFTIDSIPPIVNLQSPSIDYHELNSNIINFIFNTNDVLSEVSNCSLIINNNINGSALTPIVEDAPQQITRTLDDGNYNWSINCTDSLGNTGNSTTYNLTLQVTDMPPSVILLFPQNKTYTNNNNMTFQYYVNDDRGLLNCSLILDGLTNITNTTPIVLDQTNNITATYLSQGIHNWSVSCMDTSHNIVTPSSLRLYTDFTSPVVKIESPPNGATYNLSDRVPLIFNVTDSFGASLISNCSIYINDSLEKTIYNIIQDSSQTIIHTLSNGAYLWNVSCFDTAGNYNTSETFYLRVNSTLKIWNGSFDIGSKQQGVWNLSSTASAKWFYPIATSPTSSSRNLTLDLSPPNITLIFPLNNTNTTNTIVTFVFNVSDTLSNISSCSLIINGTIYQTNTSITAINNSFVQQLNYGRYVWWINCTDLVGNEKQSISYNNLGITYKDVFINSTYIWFSNTSNVENQNLTIFATIYIRIIYSSKWFRN